jgi:YhgE/Pip-like protein
VIPASYSERISGLVTPSSIPIAVVNEDEGAVINGQPMRLGEEVAKRITSPDTPAPPFVQWTRTDDRATALEGLEEGDFYAAIVLPEDYSRRLASMSGPPAGAPPSGAPTARNAGAG